jgi:phosphoenolpyruvate carboxykinase (GTP)
MIDRIDGKVQATETPLGLMPKEGDLDLTGLDISKTSMGKLFEINKEEWKKEIQDIEQFYSQFGGRLPQELAKQLEELKKKIA